MNGSLLPAAGEPCPAVVPAPFALGDDIMANSVCCACFRNPPHQRHVPRLLDGQVPEACRPPKALGQGFGAGTLHGGSVCLHGCARDHGGPAVSLVTRVVSV